MYPVFVNQNPTANSLNTCQGSKCLVRDMGDELRISSNQQCGSCLYFGLMVKAIEERWSGLNTEVAYI